MKFEGIEAELLLEGGTVQTKGMKVSKVKSFQKILAPHYI